MEFIYGPNGATSQQWSGPYTPDVVDGLGAERKVGLRAEQSQHRGGDGGELSKPFGETGPTGPMTILVPPTVFQKEDGVFNLPMPPHLGEQFIGTNVFGRNAREKVARIR